MSPAGELEKGRAAHASREWTEAYERLSEADRTGALAGDDLELLATAAYMTGRDEEYLSALERAHQAHADAGEMVSAIRCAFWIGVNLARRGDVARASGWLGRAQRWVEREGGDCVERGYLLMPVVFRHEAAGELEAAAAMSAEAAAIGERFGDADLFALAVHQQGHILIQQGQIENGLRLLDEAMVAVTAGELSPIASGLVYCGVILGCQDAYEMRRAQEWTAALTRWCDRQAGMVAFTGRCLVHRAEILQLRGEWSEALEEARKAGERFALQGYRLPAAEAAYRRAEVHRLRGEPAAEDAYKEASRGGYEPQPGLALLRLAQGDVEAAAAAIRRVLGETSGRAARARLLPASVEILLAAGDSEGAGAACSELETLADGHEDGMLGALAAQARGAVELSAGDPHAALPPLRRAWRVWQELEAPYEAARARELVAHACHAVGDGDTATLELDAARAAFDELGAADAMRLTGAPDGEAHDLTPRELEVLRLVAGGGTNKAIAAELVVSERTVDRHVSNIFAKLRVSSRSAATAYAYEHHLV
jgi:DNA-binding CsgD family transcriptional regulator